MSGLSNEFASDVESFRVGHSYSQVLIENEYKTQIMCVGFLYSTRQLNA